MGKKSRKQKNNKAHTTHAAQGIPAALRAGAQQFQQESRKESFEKMAQMDRLSLRQQQDAIRQALIDMGTDVSQYDADPTGDGDQRRIETVQQRDAGRELYSIGGDIHIHLTENALSRFALWCAMGCADAVETALRDAANTMPGPTRGNRALFQMLEGRETSLRLSPLLLIVSAGKNLSGPVAGMQRHPETAKILLKYGASPVAKDVLGKTVCHYGAGMMATTTTLEVVDLCMEAAKTHYMLGEGVQLHGLSTQEMNGKRGVAWGFDCNTGRRSVYLPEGREVWIKVENLKLCPPSDCGPLVLSDVQDRFGSVSLHEVILTDRIDVAEFLLRKHPTSIHTADMDGISPLKMVSGLGQVSHPAARVVMDVAREEGRKATKDRKAAAKESERRCAQCRVALDRALESACSACKAIHYCGRACQVAHWPVHKKQCKETQASSCVELEPKENMIDASGTHSTSTSFVTGRQHSDGAYQKPAGVDVGHKFVVKIQAMSERTPVLVYDETRTCEFYLRPEQAGFATILAETRKERAWEGRKTFMKASFDRRGTCTLYPGKAGTKAHYTW